MGFQNRHRLTTFARTLVVLIAIGVISSSMGCIGAMTQLMYIVKGHNVPAPFPGMSERKVAVVCVSDQSSYGPDVLTYTINKAVSMKLLMSKKDKISVVPSQEIEKWVDNNGWTETDFVEIGKGVNADMVLAIEIGSYSIHEGQTMYKGRADLTATVFDVKTGTVAYVHGPQHFTFPENGRPAIQTTDRQFEAIFLAKLTENIARQFITHDAHETVAEDASLLAY